VFEGTKGRKKTHVVDIYLAATRDFQVGVATVPCHILQETEYLNGRLSEISTNYLAQADDGAVYYFGEVVDTYSHGVITGHEGSWLVGGPSEPNDPPETTNASSPGVYMPNGPRRGETFKPEDLFPALDETDTIKKTNERLKVKGGLFSHVVKIQESSRLDSVIENKWYARGVGVIKAETIGEELELVARP
jgi:hypothetical protein